MNEESDYFRRPPRPRPKDDYPRAKRGRKPKKDVYPMKEPLFPVHLKPKAKPTNNPHAKEGDDELF